MPDAGTNPRLSRRTLLAAGLPASIPLLAACSSNGTDTSGKASANSSSGAATPGASSTPATPAQSATSTGSLLAIDGPDLSHATSGRAEVALTFHGQGDLGIARAVLAEARNAHATITVMAVGQWLAQYPQIGREVVAAGHDLGNHTWSHQHINKMSEARARDEIRRCAQAIVQSVGHQGLLFRPSDTQFSAPVVQRAARAEGYHRCLSYDVDPSDYTDPGADAVVRGVLAKVARGSIVSLHLGHQGTVDALPRIFQGLADRHLTPVAATRLLS